MQLLQLFREKEGGIVKKWVDHIFSEFPSESLRFLNNKSDRFANPLGHNFTAGLAELFRALGSDVDVDITPALEQLMKLRAVQKEHTPSESLSFIFEVKRIFRSECRKEWSAELEQQWPDFEARVDKLALQGFDLYMASRERLFNVRMHELRSGRGEIVDRARCPSAMLREEMKLKEKS
ncbi:MAG: RsbRD N-terminal domain-containing protein [Proteobacteria bacterium]|nr:RsbRD N-terminal domain-containing protein [Pseudomonadota bacterium]MBU1736890.1 RsbRD N-terminal domain-containing protein [Pseudomonadota bacterium]